MSLWHAVLLGLLQGLTEFLPVSSSGHLVLAQYALGLDLSSGATFEVMLHLGTALSIVTVYRHRVVEIVGGMLRGVGNPRAAYTESDSVRMGCHILVAMLPLALAYILFGEALESLFAHPSVASLMLVVTGVLLWLTLLAPRANGQSNIRNALLIGVAQAAALTPGISRSGATICTGLYLRMRPDIAADFSFLMVLPAIAGAALLKGMTLFESSSAVAPWPILVGTAVAYVAGVLAIRAVLHVVRRGRLHYFAYYCVAVGLLGLIWV